MKIVQFAGKFYHDNCFDEFLKKEKSIHRVSTDYTPNLHTVEIDSLEDDDSCEECSGVFSKEYSTVDTPQKDMDTAEKSDPVVDTPSPTPSQYNRKRR